MSRVNESEPGNVASPPTLAEIKDMVRRRFIEPYENPAERLDALLIHPEWVCKEFDEERGRKPHTAALPSRWDTRYVAEALREAAVGCARDAICNAPDLDALAERLNQAVTIAYTLRRCIEWQSSDDLFLLCDLEIDGSEFPHWGEDPGLREALSWDEERVLTHGQNVGDLKYEIYPRDSDLLRPVEPATPEIGIDDLPEFLWQTRQKRGLTQVEVANALGLSESYVGLIETGRRKPGIRTLRRLATWLGAYLYVNPESAVEEVPSP